MPIIGTNCNTCPLINIEKGVMDLQIMPGNSKIELIKFGL